MTKLKEPDWTGSETLPSEMWKNPLIPMNDRLEIADGAVAFRDKVIANLRKQLESKQAEIDRIMLEYCQGEMTEAQMAEWASHQKPVGMSDGEQEQQFYKKLGAKFSAVKPVVEQPHVPFELDPKELRIDTYRPGGNSGFICKPDTGVRITHLPTGLYAECSEDRSVWRNKHKAMEMLTEKVAKNKRVCDGCGNADPGKRCLGCMHQF